MDFMFQTLNCAHRKRSRTKSHFQKVTAKRLRIQPLQALEASDVAEAPSWLGNLIEQINNVKASVTKQISNMNDKVDSSFNDSRGYK